MTALTVPLLGKLCDAMFILLSQVLIMHIYNTANILSG